MKNISVIVPVYKVEQYINKCIDSILTQTYENFELILINDGSPDNCGSICDEYKSSDSRIKVIHKANEGLMSAWIDGVTAASGDYIMFVDSDDWIEKTFLEDMVKILEKYNPDLICSGCIKEYINKKIERHNSIDQGMYNVNQIMNTIYPNMINNGQFQGRGIQISRWAKIIKKKLILDNIKYCNKSISFSEDLNIMFPVLLDCNSIYVMDKLYYHYRMNNNSILHTYNSTMYNQIKLLYDILFKVSEDKGKYDFTNQLLADYLAACVQAYKNELMSNLGIREITERSYEICNDKLFIKAINNIEYRKYNLKNKAIINILKTKNKSIILICSLFLSIIKKKNS